MTSQARAEKGIKKPNIVMPVTGHVAVDKVQRKIFLFHRQHESMSVLLKFQAGHLFGIEVRHVPVDQGWLH